EPRSGAPRGDGDQSRGDDGRHGPARGGAHRGVEGQGPRAAQETEVPAPRDRFVGRPRTHAGVPGSAGRDGRVLRIVAGPGRFEVARAIRSRRAGRLRALAIGSLVLFLLSLVLVAGFWYRREFYQIGFTNLLIIGGFVTFLVIWAARLAMSGELPRGRPSGEL